jgi:hypothetical protein
VHQTLDAMQGAASLRDINTSNEVHLFAATVRARRVIFDFGRKLMLTASEHIARCISHDEDEPRNLDLSRYDPFMKEMRV